MPYLIVKGRQTYAILLLENLPMMMGVQDEEIQSGNTYLKVIF